MHRHDSHFPPKLLKQWSSLWCCYLHLWWYFYSQFRDFFTNNCSCTWRPRHCHCCLKRTSSSGWSYSDNCDKQAARRWWWSRRIHKVFFDYLVNLTVFFWEENFLVYGILLVQGSWKHSGSQSRSPEKVGKVYLLRHALTMQQNQNVKWINLVDTDKHFQGYELCFAIPSDKNVRVAKQVFFWQSR